MSGDIDKKKPPGGTGLARKRRRSPRTKNSWSTTVAIWIDHWMLQLCSFIAVIVWVGADYIKLSLSQGTQAALGAFVLYAAIKSKADRKYRSLELAKDDLEDLRELASELEATVPGSPEAAKARKALVALAMKAQNASEDDE